MSLPILNHPGGFRGGYRLYGIADGYSWEDAVAMPDGFVTTGHASVSGCSSSPNPVTGELGYVASLSTYTDPADYSTRVRHELDGSWYPTYEGVQRAAYEAGLLFRMVYENHDTARSA